MNWIEVVSLVDLYDEIETKKGEVALSLIKEDLEKRILITNVDDIMCVSEITNAEGEIRNDRCEIIHIEKGSVYINEPYRAFIKRLEAIKKGSK